MIFSNEIVAPMLTSQFTFQAYIPKKLDGEIQPIMDNMKIHSLWVLINKIDSARKTISKNLWSFFSHIMTYSKKRNDHDVRPQWMDTDTFKYQEQITIQKYTKVLESGNENTVMGFSKFITSTEWDEYIKNPFDTTARENYLQHVSVVRDPKKSRNKKLYPPYGLTFASFTTDGGVVEVKEKRRKIDAGHVNAYLIMPGIVYHLSATLKKGNIHKYVGKNKEMQLIQFLCQFGYATRKAPTVMLHVAHTNYCPGINETKFFQGCVGYYRIIPVTLFLTMLFNACLTYQEDKTTNLLISALNQFDIGATIPDEIFMNTLRTIRNFALISKLEFHAIINHRFLINHFFLLPLHLYLQLDYPGTYTTQLQFSQLKLLKNPTQVALIEEKVLFFSNSFTLGFVMSW